MADSNARPHVQTLWETKQGYTRPNLDALKSAYPSMFNSNVPPAQKSLLEILSNVPPAQKSLLEILATLPATRPANHEWITPNRQPSPREPSSPRPATPPPSPLDAAMQAVQNRIDLADQQEAHLQQLLQRQQELAEKQQRVATIQHKLQAVSQPVRYCRHCKHPLYIHFPDGALEPCTRSNRLSCGYVSHKMGQRLLVGNLECIKKRNAAKGRRKYAARKVREQAGNTAPVLYVIDGKARPQ
jgi:hypothetical protein